MFLSFLSIYYLLAILLKITTVLGYSILPVCQNLQTGMRISKGCNIWDVLSRNEISPAGFSLVRLIHPYNGINALDIFPFYVLIIELFIKYFVLTRPNNNVAESNRHISYIACNLMIHIHIPRYLWFDVMCAYHLINRELIFCLAW